LFIFNSFFLFSVSGFSPAFSLVKLTIPIFPFSKVGGLSVNKSPLNLPFPVSIFSSFKGPLLVKILVSKSKV